MLQALLGPSTGLAPLKALLAARTDGNPLFLQESVRSLVETGVLAGERGAYRLEKPLGAIHIPDRIQALLAARIDRLDEQDKALLQAVAVIGKGATTTLIGRVSGAPTSDLPGVLAALDSAGFLCGGGLLPDLTYSFRHALTHDVVYASMLRNQRCGLHARALAALQAMYGERLDEHVERLAHQAIHAEAWTEALPYLRGAAEKAVARAANVEAVEWLGAALDALRHMPKSPASIPSGIDVRLDLVAPLLQLGRLDPVLTLAHEAERLAAEIDDCHRLGRAQACLVNYHYLRGEPAQALEHGERCLALLDWQREPRLAALAHRYMAHSHHAQGDYRRAASVLEEGLASLEQTAHGGDPAATTDKVASCAWLAFARAELGDFEAAQEWAAHARALAQTREHPYPSAIAWTMTGLVAMTRGEPANAIEAVTRALDLCRGARLTVWQPIASALLGQSLAMLGRVEDAQPLLQDSVRLSRELGVRAYLARWTTSLGEGYLAAGDLESAGHEAKLAVDLACEHGERGHEAYALSLLGAIASGQDGSAGLALQHYGRALALAEALGMRPLVARIRLGIGTAWRQAGQRAAAEEHLAHAIAMLGELSMPFWFERAARELNQLGRDVVISPSRAILRERLSQLAVDVPLRLMLDRRQNERRQRAAGAHAERRGEERRRCHVDRQMRAYGLAVVAPVTT